MDGRDWSKFLYPYEQAVEELKVKFKSIRSEMQTYEEYAPIEFVTGRVKRISSILDKCARLSVPLEEMEEGIEDIAGIRIMCQFAEDIMRVAELVRKRQDMKLMYEKDYVTNQKESGYRSYHMIVRYPVQTAYGMKEVLAELQIRTLAMNFWATIEHSLNYKFKQVLPDDVKRRLQKAAEAAHRLDREMSSIREEIVNAQKSFEDHANLVDELLVRIQTLYAFRQVKLAYRYEGLMRTLYEQGDNAGLERLNEELAITLGRLKGSGADEGSQS